VRLDHLAPILNVTNVAASLARFEALGWERGFAWDDEGGMRSSEPTFASIQSGEAEIFLCLDGQGARPVWMSWFLPDRDELGAVHARAVELGYEISQEPTDEPWGMREFHLRHPDGHIFRISCESG
jgi:catechol 2,3-dioxygenase-like lactoylglutathione lyase family enzyme